MKKAAFCFALLLLFALPFLFSVSAAGDSPSTVLESVTLEPDGETLSARGTLSDSFQSNNETVYLFRIPAGETDDLTGRLPVAEAQADRGAIRFFAPFDRNDPFEAHSGYRMAIRDGEGGYYPITEVSYLSDPSALAQNRTPYPTFSSKKGLQVQFTADAQLLGVRHTVVTAFLNELFRQDGGETVGFLYSGTDYFLNKNALDALDYRIRTLSAAGIHIYLNLLLAFDSSAPDDLYYPDAEGNSSTMYAPNVSDPTSLKRIAALYHFLAERYSSPDATYGFCGSFILGYEMNSEAETNSAGLPALSDYAAACADFVRTVDTAVRSAYSAARVYISLSNRWTLPANDSTPSFFGGKEFLSALAGLCGDVPFGVAVNPYPSDLSLTEFWTDARALDNPETEYLTLKNLSVLKNFLSTEPMLLRGARRRAVISEFGVSGKEDEASETTQAAAFAYAYYLVEKDSTIEAMIWHRHVDQASERGLYYGLYSSTDLLLDPRSKKAIYDVFGAVDTAGNRSLLDSLLPSLPFDSWDAVLTEEEAEAAICREVIRSSPLSGTLKNSDWTRQTLFDFSRSLYDFYPSDNSRYLEQMEGEEGTFLRSSLLYLSSAEYMGIGTLLTDPSVLSSATYLTVSLRVEAEAETADVRLLLTGRAGNRDKVLDAVSSVKCGEWTELTFPISSLASEELSSCGIKIWARCEPSSGSELYLDVASLTLRAPKGTGGIGTLLTVFLALAGVAVIAGVLCFFLLYPRKKEQKKKGPEASGKTRPDREDPGKGPGRESGQNPGEDPKGEENSPRAKA